jgi:hypothetical protein
LFGRYATAAFIILFGINSLPAIARFCIISVFLNGRQLVNHHLAFKWRLIPFKQHLILIRRRLDLDRVPVVFRHRLNGV